MSRELTIRENEPGMDLVNGMGLKGGGEKTNVGGMETTKGEAKN